MDVSPDKVRIFIKIGDKEIEVQPEDEKIINDYPDIEIEGYPFDLEMELKRGLQPLYDAGASYEELRDKANEIIQKYNEKVYEEWKKAYEKVMEQNPRMKELYNLAIEAREKAGNAIMELKQKIERIERSEK